MKNLCDTCAKKKCKIKPKKGNMKVCCNLTTIPLINYCHQDKFGKYEEEKKGYTNIKVPYLKLGLEDKFWSR